MASLPGAADRTLTVFSFSKGYAQAGLRIGYAAGPVAAVAAMRKMVNHTVYNVPHALQRAAMAALDSGPAFLEGVAGALPGGARPRAGRGDGAVRGAAGLDLPVARPARMVGGRRLPAGARAARRGRRAPGARAIAFGSAFAGFARLCFTAVDEARLDEGIARINRVLAG